MNHAYIVFGLLMQHALAVTPSKAASVSTNPRIQVTPGGDTVAVEMQSPSQSDEDLMPMMLKKEEFEGRVALEVGVDGGSYPPPEVFIRKKMDNQGEGSDEQEMDEKEREKKSEDDSRCEQSQKIRNRG